MCSLLWINRVYIVLYLVKIALADPLAIHTYEVNFRGMRSICVVRPHPLEHIPVFLRLPGKKQAHAHHILTVSLPSVDIRIDRARRSPVVLHDEGIHAHPPHLKFHVLRLRVIELLNKQYTSMLDLRGCGRSCTKNRHMVLTSLELTYNCHVNVYSLH